VRDGRGEHGRDAEPASSTESIRTHYSSSFAACVSRGSILLPEIVHDIDRFKKGARIGMSLKNVFDSSARASISSVTINELS
jgi:hypothetical protein